MKYSLRSALMLSLALILAVPVVAFAQDGGNPPQMGDWESCPTPQNLPAEVALGAVFGLSGSIASYGQPQQQGAQLAVDQINASGYLGEGVTLSIIFEDGGSDAEASIAAFDKLVNEENVVAILGPTLSTQAFSADPIAAEAGISVIGISNTANGLTTMNDDPELDRFIFRDSLPEADVIPGTITQAADILGLKKVGVMYGNDDDFTVSGYNVFMSALQDTSIDVLREETFARGDVDFSPQLTNIINDNPDAIIVSALIAEAVPIVVQARQLGYQGPIIGGNGFNSPKLFEQAGADAEGVIVGAAWNIGNPSPLSAAFTAAYQEQYGSAPDQFAAQAYTAAWLVATAVRCADSDSPAAVRDALAAIQNFETPLGTFSFDEDRNPVHEPVAQIVYDGKFAQLSAETAAAVYGQ